MKPIIIQVPSTKDGKVTLTVKELQEMLDKAYESGKNDGTTYCSYGYCPYKPWHYSNSTPYNETPHITWTSDTQTLNSTNISTGNTTCNL